MQHLIGHVTGCVIETVEVLEAKMNHIAEQQGFTVVARAFHQFEPVGATGVLVLAESHFTAHTYPEESKVYIDVFCCTPSFNAPACAEAIQKEFGAAESHWNFLKRSDEQGALLVGP
jgi:S-adenosylmethionine decarboxylase proenzyme